MTFQVTAIRVGGLALIFGSMRLAHRIIFIRAPIFSIYPLKNRWLIRIFMGFITLGIMVIFIWLLNVVFLAMIAMLVGFAAATFSAIFIYAKYPSLSATTVFITIITGTLAANCYFFFI
ncbi:MAG: hypothetical protein ACTSQQ_11835 [Candidatus Helarchaeota archaeon]